MVPGEELAVQSDEARVETNKGRQETCTPHSTAHSMPSSPQGIAQSPLQIQHLCPGMMLLP